MQQVLKALAKRMKELRKKMNNISQEAFADHCGLHRVAIGNIEQERREPTLRTLVIIAYGFKIPVSELLVGVDSGLKSAPKSKTRTKKKSI